MTATPLAEQSVRVATTLHSEAVRRYFLSITTETELQVVIGLAARVSAQRAVHPTAQDDEL